MDWLAPAGSADWMDHSDGRDSLWHFPAEGVALRRADLHLRARGMAAALAGRGVGPGDRVVAMLDNESAALCLLLAIWWLGAIPVPLPPQRAGDGAHRHLGDIERRCSARVTVGMDGALPAAGVIAVRDLQAPPIRLGRWRPRVDDLALIQFTSGSTGAPKGVMVTHGMIAAQLGQLAENYRRAGTGDAPRSVASWLPLYHDMGLFIGFLLPLFLGADAMVAPPSYYMRNPARWFRAMAAQGSDLTFSTNSVLAATLRGLRRLGRDACDLQSLVLYIAAERISPAVLDDVHAVLGPLGLPPGQVRTGYGLAEYALGCTSTQRPRVTCVTVHITLDGRVMRDDGAGPVCVVSVGAPNADCQITICDPAGRSLGEGRLGEIVVAGPCLSPGYYNDEAASAAAMGRWGFRTGDTGFLLDGELYFYARHDERLMVGGRNIIPGDVEEAVEELSFVGPGRSALFGVADAVARAERQVLLVESPHSLAEETRAERMVVLRRHILGRFGFVPTTIDLVPRGTIEKTSSGKKRIAAIRQRYLMAK